MLEIALTLADYLIKLLQNREGNLDEYFDRYIQPAYNAAELVYADYLNLLQTIKRKIEQGEKPEELIKFLEEGRKTYQPLRMRIRAEIIGRYGKIYNLPEYVVADRDGIQVPSLLRINGDPKWDKIPQFERGILGLLMGRIMPFENSQKFETPYLHGNHTLLDILYRFSSYAASNANKRDYTVAILNQVEALEMAWKDVVNGYANYKELVIPTPSKIRKSKQKRN